jgi:exonuclease V
MSHDEFEHYDLSEFTEEELAHFDKDATKILLQKVLDDSLISASQQDISAGPRGKTSLHSFSGGPALDIAIESPTDANSVEEIPTVSTRVSHLSASRKPLQLTRSLVSGMRPRHQARNLYEQFLSWRKAFSVTDLVSPVWFVQEVLHSLLSYVGLQV